MQSVVPSGAYFPTGQHTAAPKYVPTKLPEHGKHEEREEAPSLGL